MSAAASKPAAILGEDGRGYELARRLEGCGSWRAWLGDAAYASFAQALASPATWEAFLGPTANRNHLLLQLRARALLFDKASAALDVGRLGTDFNPNYAQLHGDDIYHSLEDMKDGVQNQAPPKALMNPCTLKDHPSEKAVVGSKYHESESLSTSQWHRGEELPDAWYKKFAQNRIKSNINMYNVTEFPMKTSAGIVIKEIQMRTSEGMVDYLKVCNAHKKKRKTFKLDQAGSAYNNTMVENGTSMSRNLAFDPVNSKDEECILLPEITFPSNCVPDCAFPLIHEREKNEKVEVCEVLDNLPSVTNRNAAMIERFGIIPEYYKMGTKYRGRDGSGGKREPLGLGQAEACKISNKVVARLLDTMGFEGGSEASINVFSEILGSHICKLGRTLKVLSDSYKKQYSSIDLIKMFLQSSGHSLGGLAEIMKDGSKVFPQQTQHVRALPLPNQSPFMQASNYQRHMQQISAIYPNLTNQQKQQLHHQLRRRQIANSRGPAMNVNPDQPLVEVKLENVMDSQMDGSLNAYNKQQQLQFRQQMALSDHSGQSTQQFKQMSNVQLPQLQTQNAYNMRTPSVKVEALNDLIGGDSTFKQ